MTTAPSSFGTRQKRRILSNGNLELFLSFLGIVAFSSIAFLASIFGLMPRPESAVHESLHKEIPAALSNPIHRHGKLKDTKIFEGREKFVEILKEMDVDPMSVEEDTWKQVPTWDLVEELYGTGPVVYGLDRCEEFRNNTKPVDRRVAAAGMFNSGTNAIAILLQHNCQIPERVAIRGPRRGHGMEWQVPWGKHTPGQFRKEHTIRPGRPGSDVKKENVLPVVSIRDPYVWMRSTCKHPYTARWPHSNRCPNLVNNRKKPNALTLKRVAGGKEIKYDSLVHLWNEWYREYYSKADFPRLLVRFEDLIFYPKETTELVCSCAGGILVANNFGKLSPGKFQYLMQSAKAGPAHGKVEERTDLMMAWIKYGKRKDWGDFVKNDMDYAQKNLDKEMMTTFRYSGPSV